MARSTTAQAEVLPLETGTDIVAVIEQNPQIALLDQAKYSAFFQRVKAETEKLVPDTSTAKGRDEIRSMANNVVKTKTAIDKARLMLTSQWRDQTNQVNAAGKVIEAELKQLAADVRKPLTDWEAAEDARKDRCQAVIAGIKASMVVGIDDTAADVRARGAQVYRMTFDALEFAGFEDEALGAKELAVETLKSALARLTKEEADREELAKLRAAQAERDARDLAEREAREAKERAETEAKAAEDRRIAAEKAEADRIERIQREASQRAQREAEEKAEAERQRVQREHEQALAAERKRAADAEAAAQYERDRVAKEAADRKADADRIAAEQAKREADQAHRTRVKSAAKAAIMSCGADEETAKKIVMAIIAGEVPAVRLEF